MSLQFGVIREGIWHDAYGYSGIARPDREIVFQSSLVMEAAHKMAKLNDMAPSHVRYRLIRLPVRRAATTM